MAGVPWNAGEPQSLAANPPGTAPPRPGASPDEADTQVEIPDSQPPDLGTPELAKQQSAQNLETTNYEETANEGGEEEDMEEDDCIEPVNPHPDHMNMEVDVPCEPAPEIPAEKDNDEIPPTQPDHKAPPEAVDIAVDSDEDHDPKGNVKGTFKEGAGLCM